MQNHEVLKRFQSNQRLYEDMVAKLIKEYPSGGGEDIY